MYRTCEVYIDDLLLHGQNDEEFVINTRHLYQISWEKGVILSSKNLVIEMNSVQFVGHKVDSAPQYDAGQDRKQDSFHKARITKGAFVIFGGD